MRFTTYVVLALGAWLAMLVTPLATQHHPAYWETLAGLWIACIMLGALGPKPR